MPSDIDKKYSLPDKHTNNNAFIGLSGGYNVNEINKELDEFHNEYIKQKITANQFRENENLLENCKSFRKGFSKNIEEQSEELDILITELPNVIRYNKEQSKKNIKLCELMDSPDYVNLTNKLRNIKTNVAKLNKILLKEGIHDF
tara:strand:+ start:652 stop:1086 length:435 start_codon:yes stop_codon:yes gene_type:complete